ncbi:MAG: CHAT domain-containing protein [Bacteroidia bacterium]
MLQYEDFLIKFKPLLGGQYPLDISSPAGSLNAFFALPTFDSKPISESLAALGPSLRGHDKTRNLIFNETEERIEPKELGSKLFQALFTEEVLALWDRSQHLTNGRNQGLRLKLQIDPEGAGLAQLSELPWELLYRQDSREFFNLSQRSPVVRYMHLARPYQALNFIPPFRILVVMANPSGSASLNLDHEKSLIEGSWGSRTDVQVDYLVGATRERLQVQLAAADYHVLHFMGHGDFDQRTAKGVLVLEHENGKPDLISGEAFGVLLRDEPSLRLVFLNACKTAQGGEGEHHDPFAGVASAITLAGVPAVVAMQYPISDNAAISFAKTFYRLLPECHPIDLIMAEARKAVYQTQEQSGGMEWATPALFMRSPDGVVFESSYRLEPPDRETHKILNTLASKVRQFWIEGKLEQDITLKPPIELDKKLLPKAVKNDWEGVINVPNQEEESVPAGKVLMTLFDEKERSLLILGEPGYGKTISLLVLAQDLIRRFEQDASQPIPIVLFLSTWSDSKLSMMDWAIREINQKYKIPEEQSENLLDEGRIILMLDGLDEVVPNQREACVKAINDLYAKQTEQGQKMGLAVCSRYDAYSRLAERFNFEGAVLLQPLSEAQINTYLLKAGDSTAGLQQLLDATPSLLAEAQSPLMLGMINIAYQLDPAAFDNWREDLQEDGPHGLLVETYLTHVLERKGRQDPPFSDETVSDGLSWIAKRLKTHHHSVFWLENIQPNWMPNLGHRILNVGLYSIILGLLLGLVLHALWYASDSIDPAGEIANESNRFWYLLSPLWIFIVAIWDYWRIKTMSEAEQARQRQRNPWQEALWIVLRIIFYYIIWSIIWIVACFLYHGASWPEELFLWLSHPLEGGVFVAIMYGMRAGIRNNQDYIGMTESLRWSWKRSLKGLGLGLVGGLLVWLSFFILLRGTAGYETFADMLPNLWFNLQECGLVGLLFGGLRMGLAEDKTVPNEGIKLSIRNGLFAAVIVGPVFGLVFGFVIAQIFTEKVFIDYVIASALSAAIVFLIAFLWFGGLNVIRHYCLRFILTLTGQLPLHLVPFLDYLSDLILLQKVGGGYMFRNSLLWDHFAEREKLEEK